MASLVLADTGPLYALADASDQHHQRAQQDLQRLQKAGFAVAVAYPIVAEAYTLVARRMALPYARQWLGEVMQRAVLINPEGGDYEAAARIVQQYPDQAITLFDAVTVALHQRLGLQVWTFDRHFDLMGASRWR